MCMFLKMYFYNPPYCNFAATVQQGSVQHENDFSFQIMYLLVLVLSLFQITKKAEIYRHSSWYSSCSNNIIMYLLDI
jgi:hypothetical protein